MARLSLRSSHAWLSVVLALPIVAVAATAILIAHEDSLGTKRAGIPGLAPDVGADAEAYELKTLAREDDGTLLLGTKHGLFVAGAGGAPERVEPIGDTEVRALAAADGAHFAATKLGLFRRADGGAWTRVAEGDFWFVSTDAGAVIAVAKERGALVSGDGGASFAPAIDANAALGRVASEHGPPPYSLAKLVMDLHTGKLFFGKAGEWIWIDLVAGVMLFLTASGLVVWRNAERRKAAAAAGASAG